MNRVSKDMVAKKSKSERLGWERYSSAPVVEMRSIIGTGTKVKKNAYCSPSVSYRKLVP